MSAIKIHVYFGDDDGTESCDYRGDKFIGRLQGDEHRTIAELDPADAEDIELALMVGPKANKLFKRMGFSRFIEGVLGRGAGFRLGVWDE